MRRVAPALLVVGLALAAWRGAPGLVSEYGYTSRAYPTTSGIWYLKIHLDSRRLDWLPIPAHRIRLENGRGEFLTMIEIRREEVWIETSWRCYSNPLGCIFQWKEHAIQLVPDRKGVLVLESSLPTTETPADEPYSPAVDLRLHPVSE